jgi:hypothetical protein
LLFIIGNQVQFGKLKTQLDEILSELRRIERAEDMSENLLAPIRTAVEIINGFGSDSNDSE